MSRSGVFNEQVRADPRVEQVRQMLNEINELPLIVFPQHIFLEQVTTVPRNLESLIQALQTGSASRIGDEVRKTCENLGTVGLNRYSDVLMQTFPEFVLPPVQDVTSPRGMS